MTLPIKCQLCKSDPTCRPVEHGYMILCIAPVDGCDQAFGTTPDAAVDNWNAVMLESVCAHGKWTGEECTGGHWDGERCLVCAKCHKRVRMSAQEAEIAIARGDG